MPVPTVQLELTLAEANALRTAADAGAGIAFLSGDEGPIIDGGPPFSHYIGAMTKLDDAIRFERRSDSRLLGVIRGDFEALGYSIVSEARRKAAAHG